MTYELESLRRDFHRDKETHDVAAVNLTMAFHEAYPAGSPIQWRVGSTRKVYAGCVVRNCYGLRLEVLNYATSRTRFIYAHDVVKEDT